MNPPRTIGGNVPHGTRWRGFDIFDSIAGIPFFTNSIAPWHNEAICENNGHKSLKKQGHENAFEVEMMGIKILKFIFKLFLPNRFLPT